MRTRTVVTLYSVDLARPIVLMACSEPRNWFTALARHDGPQVVTITLVDDLLSEYGGESPDMCLPNLPICCSSPGLARGDHHGHASTRLAELTPLRKSRPNKENFGDCLNGSLR